MAYRLTGNFEQDSGFLNRALGMGISFDLVFHKMEIGGRKAGLYLIDGTNEGDLLQKLMAGFLALKSEEMPEDAAGFAALAVPYGQVSLLDEEEAILTAILMGMNGILVDGYASMIVLDARSFPERGVEEPEKDRVMRGSRDGFAERITANTALIRRRIRDPHLRMEKVQVGNRSKTDVVLAYMEDKVDRKLLARIRGRLQLLDVDALSMNQESLAECLFPYKWCNPFPKFKFSERPDSTAAHLLEGNLVVLVDNSPSAMILPSSVFDIIEEADDYYFPPLTGTYLRLSRMLISILGVILTPLWLLFMQNPEWIPASFQFIVIKDAVNIPLIWQLLILEFAIDGLRLASLNTPSMLTTPLSVIAALVVGEFAANSGWFNSETMLYMAFVALSNYTQSSFELGYALKFMRLILLILTTILNLWGFILGIAVFIFAVISNKTIAGKSYIYPILPFSLKEIKRRFFRARLTPNERTGDR